MKSKLTQIMILIIGIFLLGCENIDFDNTSNKTPDTEAGNILPLANAGSDSTTTVFAAITILGSGSDSDGQIVDYEWKEGLQLISGLQSFTYLPTSEGNHTLTLTVVDNDGALGKDSMIVFVTAEANISN